MTNNAYAGIKLWDKAHPTVTRCDITDNGTGIEMWANRGGRLVDYSYVTARNCVIAGSYANGIWGGVPTVENCTIADNRGHGIASIRAEIANCIIYFNDSGVENLALEVLANPATYSDIQGGWPGEGNIDADPLFVANGLWESAGAFTRVLRSRLEWTPGDYHLQSEGWSWDAEQQVWTWDDATSPCIDAGDPSLSLGDEAPCAPGDPLSDRAAPNTRINMGAYGGTAEAGLAPHGG
jgi:hypothetical protein